MSNLLYTIAVILLIVWVIGYMGYHQGGLLHLLLVVGLVAIILQVVRGRRKY